MTNVFISTAPASTVSSEQLLPRAIWQPSSSTEGPWGTFTFQAGCAIFPRGRLAVRGGPDPWETLPGWLLTAGDEEEERCQE